MVVMFWCCSTKGATTAVSIVKSTFQFFNSYSPGDNVTKVDYIIFVIMTIFIQDLMKDKQNVSWFIMCHFLNMNEVLTIIRRIILYRDLYFILSFFHLWYPCHLLLKTSVTHSNLDIINLGFAHSSPSLHQQKGQVYLLNYVGILVFWIDDEADQSVITHWQYHHYYLFCELLLLAVHDVYCFYVNEIN